MTENYKKYLVMMWGALDDIIPRYWNANESGNKITIDNNSIILTMSEKGVIVQTEIKEKYLFTNSAELKKFIRERKPHIYEKSI